MKIIYENLEHIYATYRMIGQGYESEVFVLNNGKVLKIFLKNDRVQKTIKNKLNKINALSKIEVDKVLIPQELVYDDKGNFLGYTMDLFDFDTEINDFFLLCQSEMNLKTKINYYKQLEKIIKQLHALSIYLVDTNPRNFLINSNGVKLCDTDNYQIGDYLADAVPSAYASYYTAKTNDSIFSAKVDQFSLAIRFLEMSLEDFKPIVAICYKDMDYIERRIDDLVIPNELKIELLNVVSSDGDKDYIGDYLDMIPNQDKRYIKSA